MHCLCTPYTQYVVIKMKRFEQQTLTLNTLFYPLTVPDYRTIIEQR